MPILIHPPAAFLHPDLALSPEEQQRLLSELAHACRCTVCEQRPGLLYTECCHRLLCPDCHAASFCGRRDSLYFAAFLIAVLALAWWFGGKYAAL